MAICKLCHKPAVLRDSHIIPEYLYKPGYDKKHRLIRIERDVSARLYQQKGFREPMLGDCCEELLRANYEEPFRKLWDKTLPRPAEEKQYVLRNFSYAEFKLFHLSVLWRASVATQDTFRHINLRALHENRMRSMLLNHDPGDSKEYPITCLILINPLNGMPIEGSVMSPISMRLKGHNSYIFIFGGCAWRYVVSSHSTGIPEDAVLSCNGNLPTEGITMFAFRPFDTTIRKHMQSVKRRQHGHQP